MLLHVIIFLNEQRPRHRIVGLIDHFPLSLNLWVPECDEEGSVAVASRVTERAKRATYQRPETTFAQMAIGAATPRPDPEQSYAGTPASTREKNRMF